MTDLFGHVQDRPGQDLPGEDLQARVKRLEARETPPSAVTDLVTAAPWAMDYARVWEPCTGTGVLADILSEIGYRVVTSDVHPWRGTAGYDFIADLFSVSTAPAPCIWTNPPFSRAHELVAHAFAIGVEEVVLFHSWSWFTQKRAWKLFDRYPPTHIAPLERRVSCWEFHLSAVERRGSTPDRFCWYRFFTGYTGLPTIHRIPKVEVVAP